ncbi:MAG: 2-dehydropantoate 2-reductase [Candidatus Eremiobacteraeota bacterium]|nr:2-dehydropantoate 2-reductase [Candidatus Eremiobacteraeota bacterium]
MVVGIVGAGGLGTLFGWSLAAEHDVRIATRDEGAAGAILGSGGLALEGERARDVSAAHGIRALLGVEIVIVAVKTYDTVQALRAHRVALDASVPIVSLQNGAEAVAQIDAALGRGRAVALAPTTEAATLLRPGKARRTARGATTLGWARGRGGDDRLAELARAMTNCGLRATVAEPIEPHVWAKLIVNAAINPLSAIAGVRNGALLELPDVRRRAGNIARETAAVAAAAGIALPFDDPVAYVEDVMRATAANRSSMLQDFERGRPTEIEAIDGAVVRYARRLGIAVPETTRALYEVRARAKA